MTDRYATRCWANWKEMVVRSVITNQRLGSAHAAFQSSRPRPPDGVQNHVLTIHLPPSVGLAPPGSDCLSGSQLS